MDITRPEIEKVLANLDLEWGVDEDAASLLDILSEAFTLQQAYSWIFFHNCHLGGVALHMLELGQHRPVFAEARKLVAAASAP